jgi:hypothetical protein
MDQRDFKSQVVRWLCLQTLGALPGLAIVYLGCRLWNIDLIFAGLLLLILPAFVLHRKLNLIETLRLRVIELWPSLRAKKSLYVLLALFMFSPISLLIMIFYFSKKSVHPKVPLLFRFSKLSLVGGVVINLFPLYLATVGAFLKPQTPSKNTLDFYYYLGIQPSLYYMLDVTYSAKKASREPIETFMDPEKHQKLSTIGFAIAVMGIGDSVQRAPSSTDLSKDDLAKQNNESLLSLFETLISVQDLPYENELEDVLVISRLNPVSLFLSSSGFVEGAILSGADLVLRIKFLVLVTKKLDRYLSGSDPRFLALKDKLRSQKSYRFYEAYSKSLLSRII